MTPSSGEGRSALGSSKGTWLSWCVPAIAIGCGQSHGETDDPSGAIGGSGAGAGVAGSATAGDDDGGTGNAGGLGGTGNVGGVGQVATGGTFALCPAPVCGNGVAEMAAAPGVNCGEPCDGADLRGESCASLGFQGGTLSCLDHCIFDVSDCESCAPLDAHLLSCITNTQPGANGIVVAATETAIALAFNREGGLWLEVLAPDLSTLASNRITNSLASELDLIATPSGWLLAVRDESVVLYSLDGQGALVSSSTIATGIALTRVTQPGIKLVTRSMGGAFVLWGIPDPMGDHGLYEAALSADGSMVAAPTRLGTAFDPNFAATATPSGVLVAGRFAGMDGSGNWNLVTVQVDASGAVVSVPRTVDEFGESPTLALTNDGGAVLAYARFQPVFSTQWVKLDGAGVPELGPVVIDSNQLTLGVTPTTIVPMDNAFFVVTPYGGVSLVGISDSGVVTASPSPIVRDPRTAAVRAARRGSEIVVAWQPFDRGLPSFGLARYAP